MVASMVRLMPILNSDGKITRLRVSVPRVDVLLDEPGGKYMLEENLRARAGQELRAHRAPSLKNWCGGRWTANRRRNWARNCAGVTSASNSRGIETGRPNATDEAEL